MSQFDFTVTKDNEVIAKGVSNHAMLCLFQEAIAKDINPVDIDGHVLDFSEIASMRLGEYGRWSATSEDMSVFKFQCERIA